MLPVHALGCADSPSPNSIANAVRSFRSASIHSCARWCPSLTWSVKRFGSRFVNADIVLESHLEVGGTLVKAPRRIRERRVAKEPLDHVQPRTFGRHS